MTDTSKAYLHLLNERICAKVNDGSTIWSYDVAAMLDTIAALATERDALQARVVTLENALLASEQARQAPKEDGRMKSCKNCCYYFADYGTCTWADNVPPIIRNLFSALSAEPSTHINFEDILDANYGVAPDHSCNQFKETSND